MRRTAVFLLATTILFAGTAEARTYDLVLDRQKVEVEPGRKDMAITVNGGITAPVLRFTDGETATIRVTNHLKETTSIHWHGLLVPGSKDGAPGFNRGGSRNLNSGDKWIADLTAAMLAAKRKQDEQATPPEPQSGIQGQGGAGCCEG